mmetsp:Transcript_75412/g.151609  ORF Transcript_75412/g.151609 Transcript_75412/m.151609 type:complete len:248 (-) Transcript_75412:733-1476(-)
MAAALVALLAPRKMVRRKGKQCRRCIAPKDAEVWSGATKLTSKTTSNRWRRKSTAGGASDITTAATQEPRGTPPPTGAEAGLTSVRLATKMGSATNPPCSTDSVRSTDSRRRLEAFASPSKVQSVSPKAYAATFKSRKSTSLVRGENQKVGNTRGMGGGTPQIRLSTVATLTARFSKRLTTERRWKKVGERSSLKHALLAARPSTKHASGTHPLLLLFAASSPAPPPLAALPAVVPLPSSLCCCPAS